MDIKLTEKQKNLLFQAGYDEEEMTPELLVNLTLWKEALNGNVSAINSVKSILNDNQKNEDDGIEDITTEVAAEEDKIKQILKDMPKEVLEINKELIHNVAFQSVQLRHLSEFIAKNGVKEKYKNGANQWGWKDRTEVKTYNNMMKSYQSCMKQLNELVGNGYFSDDGFDDDEL